MTARCLESFRVQKFMRKGCFTRLFTRGSSQRTLSAMLIFFHDAAVWLRTGKLLLQRRSLKKDSYPGMLDISSAGHMSADGADQLHAPVPLEHAKRELREELGLCFEDARFELIGTYLFHAITNGGTFIDNEITHMFLITVDESEVAKEKLKLQEDEVDDGTYFYV